MPVQVNEVVVRTTVDTRSTCTPEGDTQPKEDSSQSEIVERVLEIIRESKER